MGINSLANQEYDLELDVEKVNRGYKEGPC